MKKKVNFLFVFLLTGLLAAAFGGCGEKGGDVLPVDNTDVYTPPTLGDGVRAQSEYYVGPGGSDTNSGTQDSPFQTIQCAMLAVNRFKDEIDGDMAVRLLDGDTYLHETLAITPEDNLPNGHTLTISSAKGQRGTLNAGRPVKNWQKVTMNGVELYRARMSDAEAVRGFAVEGERMPLATRYAERNRLNRLSNAATWAWGDEGQNAIRITKGGCDLSGIRNPAQLEAAMVCEWKLFVFKVASVTGKDTLNLLQPYASWFTTPASVGKLDPGGNWFPNPKHPLWLQNDVSLIDTRGEWCFDKAEKMLYYYPVDGESPEGKRCVASKLDRLMTVYGGPDGENVFRRVQNIRFENVDFGYAGYDLLEKQGVGMVQGQSYYCGPTETAGDSGPNTVQPVPQTYYNGDIHVKHALNVRFENCGFSNTGKAAVDFDVGTQESGVAGCVFRDLGDAAVVVSNCHQGSAAARDLVDRIDIANNLIRRVGRVNLTAGAIDVYYASRVEISHNDIYDAPQCGIHVGWGWYIDDKPYIGRHVIENNRVGYTGNATADGGPIYTLGRSVDNRIEGNYVYDQRARYGGIYLDEGSCNWTVTGNLIDNKWDPEYDEAIVWLRYNGMPGGPGGSTTVYSNRVTGNYYTNIAMTDNGNTSEAYRNVTEDNIYLESGTAEAFWPNANPDWPAAAQAIFTQAGLSQEYRYLLDSV